MLREMMASAHKNFNISAFRRPRRVHGNMCKKMFDFIFSPFSKKSFPIVFQYLPRMKIFGTSF